MVLRDPVKFNSIPSTALPVPKFPVIEPFRPAEERADRENFAFVFRTVGMGAHLSVNTRVQAAALQRSAAEIPNWRTFRRLCAADISDVWANAIGDRNTIVQNRKNTWQRLFRRFAKLHKLPSQLRFYSTGGGGMYSLSYVDDQRSNDSKWEQFTEAAAEVGMTDGLLNILQQHFERDGSLARAGNR